jgi:hypothetical protein
MPVAGSELAKGCLPPCLICCGRVAVPRDRMYRSHDPAMDEDLEHLDRDALIAEVKRLRAGVRSHRDSSGHDLCWHHPRLWGLLPESSDPVPIVPEWPQFLRGCLRYRESLDEQLPHAPRTKDEFGKG